MPIFNSLGSNYTFNDAWLAFRQLWHHQDLRSELNSRLEQQFGGRVKLFYKGRDAIEFALRYFQIGENDQVITQAFACFAIEEAIKRTGARPVYADITSNSLNPDIKTLEAARKRAVSAKAVLIQHTLGVPAPIKDIKRWCQEHDLILIEDLAQSIGGQDEQGKQLGTYGDAVILSFGRDKIVDGVSGGATVIKKISNQDQLSILLPDQIKHSIIVKDMTYPLLTWLIRKTHSWGMGRIIFQLAKKTGWLTSPIASPTTLMMELPAEYSALILKQLNNLNKSIKSRTKKAQSYADSLPLISSSLISHSANLRAAIKVEEPQKLAQYLAKQGIYLTDRWYRKPVDYGSLNCHSEYVADTCPNAELAARKVFNLPTHQGISPGDIQKIIFTINDYLKTQS